MFKTQLRKTELSRTVLAEAFQPILADVQGLVALTEANRRETLAFLAERPVHTVVMTSFINDNGIESELNRGKFYGYRNAEGRLEGVALIGHSTLVEARTDNALYALAVCGRNAETPIHLVMSSGDTAERFWSFLSNGAEPKLTCREALFETAFPFAVPERVTALRPATQDELMQAAEAQAEVAFIESGSDPLVRDREGFLKRVARRIDQQRVFVVMDGDELIFKADIIAETPECIYLEGIYVSEKHRGKGIGSRCLASLTLDLLDRASNICMLSNVQMTNAHRSFMKAGYKRSDECVTLFV